MKSETTRRLKSVAIFAVKAGIATGLLIWLVRSGKLDFRALAQLQVGLPLAMILFCQALMLAFPFVRWLMLSRAQDLKLSFAEAFRVGMIGYFASLFVPSSIGIDGIRIAYLCRHNKGREHAAVSTVIVDRVVGTLGLVISGVVFGGLLFWQQGNVVLGRAVLFLGLGLGVCLLVVSLLMWTGVGRLMRPVYRWKMVGKLLEALAEYRQRRAALGWALGLSLAGHCSAFTAAFLAFLALGKPAPLLCVFAIIPLVNLSGIIPLAPMGLGVADSVAVALFSLVNVSGGAEVTMLLRGATVVLSACGGIAFVLPSAQSLPTENLVDNGADNAKHRRHRSEVSERTPLL
jgi:uncharacterized membrane protein YbhN (UPF0104 family)